MKKRVKLKRASINSSKRFNNKKKTHSIPVVLFAVLLIVIVYAGLMSFFDKLLTAPSINANAVKQSSQLASYNTGDMVFSLFLIAILFGIFIFFIYRIKLKKKRK